MKITILLNLTLLWCCVTNLKAQDLNTLMAQEEQKNGREPVSYTFKGTKIINGHSIENPAAGVLQVMFSHRFSSIQNGVYDLFGLDGATIRIGFDYGLTDRIAVGIGRSTVQKAYDGYVKIKILRQDRKGGIPISLSYLGATAVNTLRHVPVSENIAYRMYYTHQFLVARKFSEVISLQLMPTLIHRNLTETASNPNTIGALGIGGRIKLTKRTALTFEYYQSLSKAHRALGYHEAAALGVDIDTGGHIFQLHFTNTNGMVEHQFIGATRQSVMDGTPAIRLGFNLNRVFTLLEPTEKW